MMRQFYVVQKPFFAEIQKRWEEWKIEEPFSQSFVTVSVGQCLFVLRSVCFHAHLLCTIACPYVWCWQDMMGGASHLLDVLAVVGSSLGHKGKQGWEEALVNSVGFQQIIDKVRQACQTLQREQVETVREMCGLAKSEILLQLPSVRYFVTLENATEKDYLLRKAHLQSVAAEEMDPMKVAETYLADKKKNLIKLLTSAEARGAGQEEKINKLKKGLQKLETNQDELAQEGDRVLENEKHRLESWPIPCGLVAKYTQVQGDWNIPSVIPAEPFHLVVFDGPYGCGLFKGDTKLNVSQVSVLC